MAAAAAILGVGARVDARTGAEKRWRRAARDPGARAAVAAVAAAPRVVGRRRGDDHFATRQAKADESDEEGTASSHDGIVSRPGPEVDRLTANAGYTRVEGVECKRRGAAGRRVGDVRTTR